MIKLFFKCWNCHTHEVELSEKKIDKFLQRCSSGKLICGQCSSGLELIDRTDKIELSFKGYQCSNNHLNIISVFGKPGKLSFSCHGQEENFDGFIEDIPYMKCLKCDQGLIECNNSKLVHPGSPSFKVHMKLGDYWDKQRVPEPKIGTYDANVADPDNPFKPKYSKSEFEVRNKERLKQIRKKRNIPLDKTPGKPID